MLKGNDKVPNGTKNFMKDMSMCQKVLLRRWTLEWKIKAEKSFSKQHHLKDKSFLYTFQV